MSQRNDRAPDLPPETIAEFEDDIQPPWYEQLWQGLQGFTIFFIVMLVLLLAVLWGFWGSQVLELLRRSTEGLSP